MSAINEKLLSKNEVHTQLLTYSMRQSPS